MDLQFFISLFLVCDSLFLFIVGLKLLTVSLNMVSSDKIKQLIFKFSNSDFKALVLGIVITAICQSSNAVTAITLSFIASKYISFRRGLVIIIGSNIGTTLTSVFFSLNIQNYGFLFIVVGIVVLLVIKNKWYGILTLSLGLLLFGLNHLSNNIEYLLVLDDISPILVSINSSNFLCFGLGTIISFVIQSSSASIGMVQDLHQSSLLNLSCAIAFVLGANIGTTITGIVASAFCDKYTKFVALLNFLFNFVGSVIFILFITPYTSLLLIIKDAFHLSNSLTVSFSHIIYNIITVFSFMILLEIYDKMKRK